MSYFDRCRICTQDEHGNDLPRPITDELPHWTIKRRGDAVISWACNAHLAVECESLQRWERPDPTELVVTMRAVDAAIQKIVDGANPSAPSAESAERAVRTSE